MEKEKDSYEAQYIVKRNVKLEKLSSIPYNSLPHLRHISSQWQKYFVLGYKIGWQSWIVFPKNGQLGLFLFIFILFKQTLSRENRRLQGDSNSDPRSGGVHTDHLTTTTAQSCVVCICTAEKFLGEGKCIRNRVGETLGIEGLSEITLAFG